MAETPPENDQIKNRIINATMQEAGNNNTPLTGLGGEASSQQAGGTIKSILEGLDNTDAKKLFINRRIKYPDTRMALDPFSTFPPNEQELYNFMADTENYGLNMDIMRALSSASDLSPRVIEELCKRYKGAPTRDLFAYFSESGVTLNSLSDGAKEAIYINFNGSFKDLDDLGIAFKDLDEHTKSELVDSKKISYTDLVDRKISLVDMGPVLQSNFIQDQDWRYVIKYLDSYQQNLTNLGDVAQMHLLTSHAWGVDRKAINITPEYLMKYLTGHNISFMDIAPYAQENILGKRGFNLNFLLTNNISFLELKPKCQMAIINSDGFNPVELYINEVPFASLAFEAQERIKRIVISK
ncbi:MAG: hypothetical protein WCJ70_00530 [bacterium]